MSPYPTLLSPVRLGRLFLRNRVLSTSHQTTLVHDHLPTDELVAYHAARARGGVGAIVLEATAVDPTGMLTPHTLAGFRPEIVAGYRKLSTATREHDARLLVQLFHGGREQMASSPRAPALAPSAVPSARFKSEPRSLTMRELRELVDGYAAAARLAHEGDLDGIELSFSHGYLVPQFFSPASNHREDAYNGDLEARLLLAREIIAAVRQAAPRLVLGVRLSADERSPGMLDATACAEIAGALCRDGELDFVSLVLGHSATYAGSTWIVPPPPIAENVIAAHLGPARTAVGTTAVIATSRIADLQDAEELLAGGVADAVGMTRALIADPSLLQKAADGVEHEIVECIGCNQACIGHYHAGMPIACVVNPRTGRERSLPKPVSTRSPRRVLVAGGGPAGVAAAIEAAQAGHRVVLRERGGHLGGQLRLAARAPAHREMWDRWSRNVETRLRHLGVRIERDCHVATTDCDASWDLIVLATGARPFTPTLPHADGVAFVSGWDAIARPSLIAGPVLVADWGGEWTGLDATEVLVGAGLEVELACAAVSPGETLHQYQRNLYLARLDSAGVRIRHHTELAQDEGRLVLRHVFSGRTEPPPAVATIVLAQGRVPVDELWRSLEGRAECVPAGDVRGPRTMEEATLEGTLAAAQMHYEGSRRLWPGQ